MHKFLIDFLIYFRLTCFRLSLSPSSRGALYKFGNGSNLLGMGPSSGADWNCTVQTPSNLAIETRTTAEFVHSVP
jgi:hypothetical protein